MTSNPTTMPARWLIEGTLQLTTPLHLGSGEDEEIDGLKNLQESEENKTWIAGVTRDANGLPCIPGSSLRGAWRALAMRRQPGNGFIGTIFGKPDNDKTIAGYAEFYGATMLDCPGESGLANFCANRQTAYIPHTAIDRVTRSVADKKLFHTGSVPPGARFAVRIIVQGASEEAIAWLLDVLGAAENDELFVLGAHASQCMGKVEWSAKPSAKIFSRIEAANWLNKIRQGEAGLWTDYAVPHPVTPTGFTSEGNVLALPIKLKFHTPFLVKQRGKENGQADAAPRLDHAGCPLLPAAGFRGALRAQAGRILRTLIECNQIAATARPAGAQEHDTMQLDELLFGKESWQSLVWASDFVGIKQATSRQELIAIDRFTGGGKDSAKFNVDYCECPTLKGELKLDLRRLRRHIEQDKQYGEARAQAALGLLSLIVRDLSEGDISFGFGRAKGYGQCTIAGLLDDWRVKLGSAKLGNFSIEACVTALHKLLIPSGMQKEAMDGGGNTEALTPSSIALQESAPAAANPAGTVQTAQNGEFHNPYHFIPFAEPKGTWQKYGKGELEESPHGHHRYTGLSGRIVCKLTTKTPVFIGNEREEAKGNGSAGVTNFKLAGTIAIPATSLRGMISSLFESISASNLRVLAAQKYSMRKGRDFFLSAIGRILEKDEKHYLEPLCVPMMPRNNQGRYSLPPEYHTLFPCGEERLKVYFDSGIPFIYGKYYYMPLSKVDCYEDATGKNLWFENDPANPVLRFPSEDNGCNALIGQKKNDGPILDEVGIAA